MCDLNVIRSSLARVLCRASVLGLLLLWPAAGLAQNGEAPPDPAEAAAPDSSAGASGNQAQPISNVSRRSLFAEPSIFAKGFNLAETVFGDGDDETDKTGFYPEFSNMITGAGFFSAGPGYRVSLDNGNAIVDTSAAVSWHLYKMAQVRFELPKLANDHLVIGTQAMWQDNTQISYFGLGPDTVDGNETQYRLRTVDLVGYAIARPREWLSFRGELGWLNSPRVSAAAGTFNPDYPDSRLVFSNDPGMSEASQPDFVHSEVSVMASTLDSRSYPTKGGQYRVALTTYWDQRDDTFSFNQYEAEAIQMMPLGDSRFTLGLHGWTVFSDVTSGHSVPFYLVPVLGGHNTLRAYDDFQFHDLNTVVATAELRIALMKHVDAAAFFDAGNVAPRYGDLNFAKRSIGAGFRLHTDRTTFGRLDVVHGDEGWRVLFRTSDPFKLSRVTRRIAAVPFVP
jgi:Omp85 superfamily domain